jgi:hypothetical protein
MFMFAFLLEAVNRDLADRCGKSAFQCRFGNLSDGGHYTLLLRGKQASTAGVPAGIFSRGGLYWFVQGAAGRCPSPPAGVVK